MAHKDQMFSEENQELSRRQNVSNSDFMAEFKEDLLKDQKYKEGDLKVFKYKPNREKLVKNCNKKEESEINEDCNGQFNDDDNMQ